MATAGPWTQTRPPAAVQAWMTPMALGGSTHHSDPYGLVEAQPLSTKMALCGSPYPCLCGPWWQYGPWLPTHTPAAVGPWTQTWSYAAAEIQMSPWPSLATQVTQSSMDPVAWPWNTHHAQSSSSNPRNPCGYWWQQEPWPSTQTLNATGPWTQTVYTYLTSVLPLCVQTEIDCASRHVVFLG